MRFEPHPLRLLCGLSLGLFSTGVLANEKGVTDVEGVRFFESRIRPVLVEHCTSCHGDKPDKLKGGLYLTTREGWQAGGDSGPVIVPGNPSESLIIKALKWEDDYEMPPKQKLADRVIQDFETWIEMGAPDPRSGKIELSEINLEEGRRHWAFQPLAEMPQTSLTVDDYIREKLEAQSLQMSPEAESEVLIRRLYLGLTGLPPTPEQLSLGLTESHEKTVDKLLNSPHFGERWARHWLDVARFAESNGYEVDNLRRGAFQFRDWVIRAFNDDLPFDEFVRSQIAGDLLRPDNPDAHIATGFLVAGPFSHPKPKAEELIGRYDEIDDMVGTMGSAFLAQTISCARCHDHKFEPIPQEDYYALASVFSATDRLRVTISKKENDALSFEKIPEKRGKEKPLPKDGAIAAYVASEYRTEPVHFLIRGNPEKPTNLAIPGLLQVVGGEWDKNEHPRIALAHWLTDPENGAGHLIARVMVNRLWHHHFGTGVVATPNDFGIRGDAPSHPQLLDFLAAELIKENWSLKHVHRLILKSAAWKQSSVRNPKSLSLDPGNRLLSSQNIRRLEAEPLRDSLLFVGGRLDSQMFGKGSPDPRMKRRSIYFESKRTELNRFLQTFNAPGALTSIGKRTTTTVAPQALLLMNSPLVRASSESLAAQIESLDDPIGELYLRALSRSPSNSERQSAREFLASDPLVDLCQAILISNEFVYVR